MIRKTTSKRYICIQYDCECKLCLRCLKCSRRILLRSFEFIRNVNAWQYSQPLSLSSHLFLGKYCCFLFYLFTMCNSHNFFLNRLVYGGFTFHVFVYADNAIFYYSILCLVWAHSLLLLILVFLRNTISHPMRKSSTTTTPKLLRDPIEKWFSIILPLIFALTLFYVRLWAFDFFSCFAPGWKWNKPLEVRGVHNTAIYIVHTQRVKQWEQKRIWNQTSKQTENATESRSIHFRNIPFLYQCLKCKREHFALISRFFFLLRSL